MKVKFKFRSTLSAKMLLFLSHVIVSDGSVTIQESFEKMDSLSHVTGKRSAELTATSAEECSVRCIGNLSCKAILYQGTRTHSCILIDICNEVDPETFTNDDIFVRIPLWPWTPPTLWCGPEPALYRDFDTSQGLILMEGTEVVATDPTSVGKVNSAWSLDRSKSQWIDLGNDTGACITKPETCGAAGGALSIWVYISDCSSGGGVFSSSAEPVTTGLYLWCVDSRFGSYIRFPGYRTYTWCTWKLNTWTHIVLNYATNPDRYEQYSDGVRCVLNTAKGLGDHPAGSGQFVIGKLFTDQDTRYSTLKADELLMFNASLTSDEINQIYSQAL